MGEGKFSSRQARLLEGMAATLVLAAAFAMRMQYIAASPLWVDEAESSINSLTILQNGYPTDSYLGLPLYENTLVQHWPESAEYEFRDSSYSDRHYAVYHGWLPLYSIAASFLLHGVQPDEADGSRTVKHDLAERVRRTTAARLPAVVFGTAFLLAVFIGGKVLYGRDAAWAGLILGAIHPWQLDLSRQARYYSAEVGLSTAACFMLWRLLTKCKWKDIWLTAILFILLFHTHILGFCTAAAAALVVAPLILRRHEFALRKLLVFGGLVAVGVLPWIFLTRFDHQQVGIPRAWALLELPTDIFRYPPIKMFCAVPGALVVVLLTWVILAKPRLSARFRAPLVQLGPVTLYLAFWIASGYVLFLRFVPAVSFATNRMNLVYWGPMLLLASAICAAAGRLLTPRSSAVTATVLLLSGFFVTGHRLDFPARYAYTYRSWQMDSLILDQVNAMHLEPDSRLYASPNDHLTLSFYSGLPFQSILPVRKTFLDSYRGEIVYVDTAITVETGLLTPQRVREEALRNGQQLSNEELTHCFRLLISRGYRDEVLKALEPERMAHVEAVPSFAEKLMAEQCRQVKVAFANSGLDLMTRGYDVRTWTDWRNVVQYRFVDPVARSGRRANYAERLRGAELTLLTASEAAIYRSKWHPPEAECAIALQFAP